MSTLTAPIIGEKVLNLGDDAGQQQAFVARSTDPNIVPQPYVTPADFTAQYPQPLDTTEIIAMCEEITEWQTIPIVDTSLKAETWRELNELAFTSGSSYISFADGECPEEYRHDGDNTTVNLKNIGARKSLSLSDIKHSAAVAGAGWNGINRLVGPVPSSAGMPGGSNAGTSALNFIADVKEKEVVLASALVINGEDRLLVKGNDSVNALEFDGIETTLAAETVHNNSSAPSGTFSAATFDRFLSESCAKPTHVHGHPQAIQEVLSGYFQLGFAGSEVINFSDGNRITPGFNFAGFVNTGVGRLTVVSDANFTHSDAGGGAFQTNLYALRHTHNGAKLVYRPTQFRLSMTDLAPGCTAVSFQVWAKTALVIKHLCAHGRFSALFTGNIVTTCTLIG